MRLTSVILVTTAPKQYTMRPAFQPQFRKSKSMTKKLHIKTWGCQMNEYDSSKMADLLDATHGYQLTDVAEEADVLLLNTCSIREKAQEKVFHQLGRWKLLKEKPQADHRCRWLCCVSGRRPYSPTRALCRYYFWAANPASSAGND